MRHPDHLTQYGTPPPPNPGGRPCTECGVAYELHSGHLCLICRGAIEHHTPATLDAEITACARLSDARQAGGHTLRPHEQWCIEQQAER